MRVLEVEHAALGLLDPTEPGSQGRQAVAGLVGDERLPGLLDEDGALRQDAELLEQGTIMRCHCGFAGSWVADEEGIVREGVAALLLRKPRAMIESNHLSFDRV